MHECRHGKQEACHKGEPEGRDGKFPGEKIAHFYNRKKSTGEYCQVEKQVIEMREEKNNGDEKR
jgi:hypothetical protein